MERLWTWTNGCQTARGAILIFLLLQMTNGATGGSIGVSNPFSEYVKFLPLRFPLPTFWDESERTLLTGTSLEAALSAKLNSLDRDFTQLKEKTSSIDWCRKCWWNADSGTLTFHDWKMIDAIYVSIFRAYISSFEPKIESRDMSWEFYPPDLFKTHCTPLKQARLIPTEISSFRLAWYRTFYGSLH